MRAPGQPPGARRRHHLPSRRAGEELGDAGTPARSGRPRAPRGSRGPGCRSSSRSGPAAASARRCSSSSSSFAAAAAASTAAARSFQTGRDPDVTRRRGRREAGAARPRSGRGGRRGQRREGGARAARSPARSPQAPRWALRRGPGPGWGQRAGPGAELREEGGGGREGGGMNWSQRHPWTTVEVGFTWRGRGEGLIPQAE